MEYRDIINEPFKETLHENIKESKYKKKSNIFFIITVIVLVGVSISLFLYLDKSQDKENKVKTFNQLNWDWKPVGNRIKTRWAEKLDQNKIWQEYPRPQLERKDWMNLNGPWKYSIRTADNLNPDPYDGYILVPFPVESSLSGVMKTFTKDDILWSEKEIEIPEIGVYHIDPGLRVCLPIGCSPLFVGSYT